MAPCQVIGRGESVVMLEPQRITRTQRELRSLIRDVGEDDPEAFASLVSLAAWLSREGLPMAAERQLARGYSWTEIARPLGVSRQAARQRYGR